MLRLISLKIIVAFSLYFTISSLSLSLSLSLLIFDNSCDVSFCFNIPTLFLFWWEKAAQSAEEEARRSKRRGAKKEETRPRPHKYEVICHQYFEIVECVLFVCF